MKLQCNTSHPFIYEYLNPLISVHQLLFVKLLEMPYDTYDLIDAYMQTSALRHDMDQGVSSALNKGYKQLLNSINLSNLVQTNINTSDRSLVIWIATIYNLLQWEFNLSSSFINTYLPAKKLSKLYYPLHETSDQSAIYKLYFTHLMNNEV